MRPHSGPFLSFLAYYMGAPSDQFLRIEYGGPLRSVSSLIMEASLCLFFHTIWGPSDHFFAYYIGPPRSLSSLTIWGPSDHFLLIQYGGPPQILFFSQNIWGPPQISFSAYYMGPLRLVSVLTIWGPLRSVSVHTFWGPLSDQFFLLLDGAPSGQFLCLL